MCDEFLEHFTVCPDGKEVQKSAVFKSVFRVQKRVFQRVSVCTECTILKLLNALTVDFKGTQNALPFSLKTLNSNSRYFLGTPKLHCLNP